MPRYKKPHRTLQYTNDFKVKAVQLPLADIVTSKSFADAIDIHPFMLSRWRKEYWKGKFVVKKVKTADVKADV